VSARRDVALLMAEHGLAERYACRLLAVDRSTYRYEPRPDRNAKLREALLVLAKQQPRYGYRRLWALCVFRSKWATDSGAMWASIPGGSESTVPVGSGSTFPG
jgi:hypothetical protein